MAELDLILDILNKTTLFKSCTGDSQITLAKHSHLITAKKGQVLFSRDDKADKFFVISTGWVKLFTGTEAGDHAIINILKDKDIFGETSVFNDDTYTHNAEAAEDSVLISIPRAALQKEIANNPLLTLALLAEMTRYREQQDMELEHRTLQNAPQRLSCFLIRLAKHDTGGPLSIKLPYDKTLVAARLGMQPETFSRTLAKLKKITGLHVKGSKIDIDNLESLTDYACSSCSAQFPCKDLIKNSHKA